MKKFATAVLAIFSILVCAQSAAAAVSMVLDLGASGDYFDIPYPSDLHRRADGSVDRARYPVPEANPLSAHYRDLADGMEGFGVTEAVFIRFTGALAAPDLPGAERSVAKDSPLLLVNIDPDSPGYRERIPVESWFHRHKRGPLNNLLAMAPYPGFVLRENTVHAAIVLRSLDPALEQSPELDSLLAGKDPGGKLGPEAARLYGPLADYLAEAGIDPAEVAAATVYTTGDPTRGLRQIMAYIEKMPALELDYPPKPYRDHESFYILESSFTAPQFQTGKGGNLFRGGKILFDDEGRPVIQRHESIPVKIMVPKGKMPAEGFPLVIYLHGGGNNSDEFSDHIIKSKDDQFTPGEGPARVFAERNIAGITSATVKNPERLGNRYGKRGRFAELPFYNFWRGDVLVANHWQAAADHAMLLRLARELTIDPSLCPETDASAAPGGMIRFDRKLYFAMGFSMGGTILGSWSGVEPGIVATIPSGASGHWGLLIRNFTAIPAKPRFFAWLTNGKKDEPMDMRWPAISVIQAVLEPADTITFAPHVFRRPFPGQPAKNVYLAVGGNDFYTKDVTQNAIVLALGLPLAGDVIDGSIMPGQRIMGYAGPLGFPVSGNVVSEDGQRVTAAALQYEPDHWTNEGHNVNYNLTETKHQYGCFLRTLADTGAAVIPPPADEQDPCVHPR